MGSGSLGSTSTSFLAVVRSTAGIGIPAAWAPLYRHNLGLALRRQASGSRPVRSSRTRGCACVLSGNERTKLKLRRTVAAAAAAAAAANAFSEASSSRVDEVEAIKEILPDGNYHSFESVEEREDFWLTWRHLMPLHHSSIDHGGCVSLSQCWPIERDPRGTCECHVSTSASEIEHDCFSSQMPAGTRDSESEHRRRRRRRRSSYQQRPGESRATTRDSNLRRAASRHPCHRQPSVYPFMRLQLRATRGMRVHPESYQNGQVASAAQSLIQAMLSDRYSVLAAPQIGIGYRMIAVRRPVGGGHASVIKLPPWRLSAPWRESRAHPPTDEESDDRESKVEVLINPRIILKGKKIGLSSDKQKKKTSEEEEETEEEEEEEERDPSFPFVRVPVRRASWVIAQARTVDDRLVFMLCCGEKAGSFQRAMNYLDGFLSIDVATPSSKDLARPQLRSLEKKAASVATWHPAAATLAFYNLVNRSSVGKSEEEKEKEEKEEEEKEEGEYASCDYGDGRDLRTDVEPREKPITSHDARTESDATWVRPNKERTDYVLPRVDHPACFTAYHEAGHAVVGSAFPDHVRVEGVFLEKAGSERNRAARGRGGDDDSPSPSWSWSGGTEIVFLVSNKDLRALTVERMAVWLGGLISEELMFGRADTYDGPLCSGSFADDLLHVSRTARRYLDACHVSTDEYVSALHCLFLAGNQDGSGASHVEKEPLHQNEQKGEDRGLGVLAAIADPDVHTGTGARNLLQKDAAAAASAARWEAPSGISAAPHVQVAGSNPPDSALTCSSPPNCSVTNHTGTSFFTALPIPWRAIELPGTTGSRGLEHAQPSCRPLGLPRNGGGPYDSTLLALIDEAYEVGRSILVRDVHKLHRLASLLMDKRRLKQHQIQEIWNA